MAAAAVVVGSGACRGYAAAVESDSLAFTRVVQHNECIAAETAFHGQNHTFRGGHGDRGVKRIAPALQDAEPDECRHRVRGANHPARAERVGPLLHALGFGSAQTP